MADRSVAEQYYKEGKYLEACQIYDILLNDEPKNINLLQGKANCFMSLFQWHECFKTILEAFDGYNGNLLFLENFVDSLAKKLSARMGLVEDRHTKEFEENLICECCYEVLCYPITISCGHTFCRQCMAKNNKCLSCSNNVINGKLEDLSVNIVLTNIIERCFEAKTKAMQLRCEGNECFSNNKYEDALKKYTEALHLGILPEKYLDHLSLLSEAMHLLHVLGNCIPEEELCRAEVLLNEFYKKFPVLYPGGSCGLNVHNTGAHLVHFVHLWGPLWAWSCFAFEDANAMVLQSVHGTGNVVNQVVKIKEATAMLRQQENPRKVCKIWTKTTKVTNFEIADPTNHYILGNLSHVYLVLDEYQTALDYADRACKMIPNWKKGFYRKAQAYVGLKNYSQAVVCFLKVLLIDPQNHIARRSLNKVFVEILTNSTNLGSQNTPVIDDLASSLDGLIEVHGDTKQNNVSCVEDVTSVLSEKLSITDLECSLCCRMYYDPVTCPCGHTFCQWCLNRCLDHKHVCPVCRYLIKEYINNEKQNVTGSIQALCKKYFPQKFEERKHHHEEEVTKLASVASDTDEDIPIFVCTLAIPTIPCRLCIFEPRYRLMIRECMESGSRQFGMCCPSDDNSFSDYGVMLEIEDFTLLADGRSLVKSVGGRRFKVLSRGTKDGYNTAKVEWLKDESFSEEETEIIRNRQQSIYAKIVDWFSSLSIFTKIHLLTEMAISLGPPECDYENINYRNGPNWIWWSLHLLPMQPSLKLQIISMTDIRQRLDKIEHFFRENTTN